MGSFDEFFIEHYFHPNKPQSWGYLGLIELSATLHAFGMIIKTHEVIQ